MKKTTGGIDEKMNELKEERNYCFLCKSDALTTHICAKCAEERCSNCMDRDLCGACVIGEARERLHTYLRNKTPSGGSKPVKE